MTVFILASIGACLLSGTIIVWAIWNKSAALIRPSFIASAFIFVYCQCGSVIMAAEIFETLTGPWNYFTAVHIVPIFGLGFSVLAYRSEFQKIASSVQLIPKSSLKGTNLIVGILIVVIYLTLSAYLAKVPIPDTGLWATIQGAADADLIREKTFKLLDAPIMLYAFTLMEKVVAPLAAALCAFIALSAAHSRSYSNMFFAILCIPLIALPTAIYGARGPASMVLLAALSVPIFYAMIRGSLRTRLVILFLPLFALAPAILLTFLKNGSSNIFDVWFQFLNILDRLVVRGNIGNIWHIHYVELFGFHGIEAVPKIAAIFGKPPIDIFNAIGRYFGPGHSENHIDSVSVGALFSVLGFSILGPIGHLLSLFVIVSIDLLIMFYRRLSNWIIIPTISALIVPLSAMSFSMITTVLTSKGLLLLPLLAIMCAKMNSMLSEMIRTREEP